MAAPSYADPQAALKLQLLQAGRLPGDPSMLTDDALQKEMASSAAKGIDFQPGPPPAQPAMPDYEAQRQRAGSNALLSAGLGMLAQRPTARLDAIHGRTGQEGNQWAGPAQKSALELEQLPEQQEQDRMARMGAYSKALAAYSDAKAGAHNKNVELAGQRVSERAVGQQANNALESKADIEGDKLDARSGWEDARNKSREGVESSKLSAKGQMERWRNENRLQVAKMGADARIQSATANAAKSGLNGKQVASVVPDYEHNRTAIEAMDEAESIIKQNPEVLNLMPNAMKYENGHFVITAQDPTARLLAQNIALAHHYLIQNDKRRGSQLSNSLLQEVLPKFGQDNGVALQGLAKLKSELVRTNTGIQNTFGNFDFGSMDWKPQAKSILSGQMDAAAGQGGQAPPNLGTMEMPPPVPTVNGQQPKKGTGDDVQKTLYDRAKRRLDANPRDAWGAKVMEALKEQGYEFTPPAGRSVVRPAFKKE